MKIDNIEVLKQALEKLSMSPEWAEYDATVKQKLINDIHEDLCYESLQRAIEEVKPKKRSSRKRKVDDTQE